VIGNRVEEKKLLIRTILTILCFLLIAVPELSGRSILVNAQTPSRARPQPFHYACPMHPGVTSKRAGKCPKCRMALRRVKGPLPTTAAPVVPAQLETGATAPISSALIPDVDVHDQNGNRLKFKSDLIKGKTVAINFIFTTCTGICPPLTATFRRVQQQLTAQKLPVDLISISVDPTTDTPERLREFAAKFRAAPGWTFVTGDKAAIDSILQALGTAVANKTDHTPMILIGNDVSNRWTRSYGLSSPTNLVKVIAEVASDK